MGEFEADSRTLQSRHNRTSGAFRKAASRNLPGAVRPRSHPRYLKISATSVASFNAGLAGAQSKAILHSALDKRLAFVNPWPSFLRHFALATGIVSGALLSFVLAIDAYGLFGTRILPNRVFPAGLRVSRDGDRVLKAIEMARSPASTVVVGSSRVALGFDPDHVDLAAMRLYNAGLLAARGSELSAVARYAAREMPRVERVLWGIDVDSLFVAPDWNDFARSAFAGVPRLSGYAAALASWETLGVSADTLRFWSRGVRASFTTSGWGRRTINYRDEPRDWWSLFRQEFASTVNLTTSSFAARVQYQDAIMQELISSVAALRERGVAVDLFFTPRYVWRLELERQSGATAQVEALKRWIVAAATEVNGCGAGPQVRVFDFDRADPVTSEPVPPGLHKQGPRYFVETMHMTPTVGAMIAALLVSGQDNGFGWRLTPDSIEAEFVAGRAALAAWGTGNPEDVAHVASLLPAGGRADQVRPFDRLDAVEIGRSSCFAKAML